MKETILDKEVKTWPRTATESSHTDLLIDDKKLSINIRELQ